MNHNEKQKFLFALEKLYHENPKVKEAMDKLMDKIKEMVDKLPGEK
tara:strand:- start:2406 stop:2543 length:138 start_codon:yes stop_codon:yes gene_type:complete